MLNSDLTIAARQGQLSSQSSSGQFEIRLVIHPKLTVESPPEQVTLSSEHSHSTDSSFPLCIQSNDLTHYSVSVTGRQNDKNLQLTNRRGQTKPYSASILSAAGQPVMQFETAGQTSPKLLTRNNCKTAPVLQINTFPDKPDEAPYSGVATIIIQAQ